jgi:hypothetical protein
MISRNGRKRSVARGGFYYDTSRISGSFQSSNDTSLDPFRPSPYCDGVSTRYQPQASAFGCEAVGVDCTDGFFVYILDLLCLINYIPSTIICDSFNMKKKRGRPRLASGQAKAQFINLRFSPAEARQIDAAAKRAKLKRAKWARNTLLSAAGGDKL